jgi:hypothetical protein
LRARNKITGPSLLPILGILGEEEWPYRITKAEMEADIDISEIIVSATEYHNIHHVM